MARHGHMSTPVNTAVYGHQLTSSMGLSDPVNGYSFYHSQGDTGAGAVWPVHTAMVRSPTSYLLTRANRWTPNIDSSPLTLDQESKPQNTTSESKHSEEESYSESNPESNPENLAEEFDLQ